MLITLEPRLTVLHLFRKKDNTGIGAMAAGKFEKSLVTEVLPYIEKNYRVMADASHRAITGFSMGGYQNSKILQMLIQPCSSI